MFILTDRDESTSYGLCGEDYLQGREVRLRTILPSDYQFLRELETNSCALVRFRQRGLSLSPESHLQSLWRGVLCQFLVTSVLDGHPLGLVTSYGADFRNGRSYIAVIVRPEIQNRGPAMEAMRIFIDYLFAVFPLRKLMAEVIEFNWLQFSGGEGRVFATEGILKGHEFHAGRYWDVYLLAVYRDQWTQFLARPPLERVGLSTPVGNTLMTFSAFAESLASEFGWKPESLSETATLREELGADSITYLELLMILEDLVGAHEINAEVITEVDTLGELYHLFLALSSEEERAPFT